MGRVRIETGVIMKRLFSLPGVCLVGLLLLPFLPGCKKASDVKLVTVKGKVTAGGELVKAGFVTFHPQNKDAKTGQSTGEIQSDGTYTLRTDGNEGAPEGQYKVTISPSMVPTGGTTMPKSPVDSKYTRIDTTDLIISVPKAEGYDLNLAGSK